MSRWEQNLQVSTALAGILAVAAIFSGADAGESRYVHISPSCIQRSDDKCTEMNEQEHPCVYDIEMMGEAYTHVHSQVP